MNPEPTIHCPNCRTSIPLSDAVTHSIREQMDEEFADRCRALEGSVAERERQLEADRSRLEKSRAEIDAMVTQRLNSERDKLASRAKQEAQDQLTVEMQDLRTQLDNRNRQLDEARQTELALRQQQHALEERSQNLDSEVARRLDDERGKILEVAQIKAQEQFGIEVHELRTQLESRSQKLAEAQAQELILRQQQRSLEERTESLELEVARKLDAERAKIRDTARQQVVEEQQFRTAEREKLISDMQRQIEVLQQKAHQGSQQVQGKVLELGLESVLREAFPFDQVDAVLVGVRGADLLHRVRTGCGTDCGTLIWETKRAKNWSAAWIGKLKEDQRSQGAEIAILVTEVLPDGITQFAQIDGIWVASFSSAAALAVALRQGLIETASARRAEHRREEKMHVLYDYLAGPAFRQKIEAIVEAFSDMKTDLDKERNAMQRIWKKREKQLVRVLTSTATLYGDLQGIVGSSALPEIAVLELPASDEDYRQIEEQPAA